MDFYTSIYSAYAPTLWKIQRKKKLFLLSWTSSWPIWRHNHSVLRSTAKSQVLNLAQTFISSSQFVCEDEMNAFVLQCCRWGNWGSERQVVCPCSQNWWDPQDSNLQLLNLSPVTLSLCPSGAPSMWKRRTRHYILNFYHLHSGKVPEVSDRQHSIFIARPQNSPERLNQHTDSRCKRLTHTCTHIHTQYYRLGLNQQKFMSQSSGSQKSETQGGGSGLISFWGPAPRLTDSAFSLSPHVAFPPCKHPQYPFVGPNFLSL